MNMLHSASTQRLCQRERQLRPHVSLAPLCTALPSHQRLEQLPSSISGLTSLTRLAVAACSLRELTPGPYLHGLRELNLFANGLRWAGWSGLLGSGARPLPTPVSNSTLGTAVGRPGICYSRAPRLLRRRACRPCSCVPPALAHPEWRPTGLRLLDLSSNHSHFLRWKRGEERPGAQRHRGAPVPTVLCACYVI